MSSIASFLSRVFTALILKPADYFLFGGTGVLWRPREYWQQMGQRNAVDLGEDAFSDNFLNPANPASSGTGFGFLEMASHDDNDANS